MKQWVVPATVAALLAICCVGGCASAQAPTSEGGKSQDSYRISVDVELVVLQATVRDRNGRFVADLHQQDFTVYEDGARQAVSLFRREDIPVTVGLVIDHSGSMKDRLNHVIAAARTFVQASNESDRMFVVNFNERASLGLPPGMPFTNRPEELESAILRTPAAGQTSLYDALLLALSRMKTSDRERNVLIVISDGGDNTSVATLDEVLRIAGRSNTLVYTVGIYEEDDPDKNPRVLRQLSRSTGGDAFFPQQMGEVVAICERIAHEIRNQYTLGYVPTNVEKDGTYRAIRVEARSKAHGRLSVRARAGYFARGASVPLPQGGVK